MKLFLRQLKDWKQFKELSKEKKEFVFYSEGGNYLPHLFPVMELLTKTFNKKIIYLTSSQDDPLLNSENANISSFYIGSGTIRTLLFASLSAKIVVMTMPDLHYSYIKKSPNVKNYVYLHHSIVSTHMVYQEKAFDYFDTIFCVGEHHIKETRTREKKIGLKRKRLIKFGYPRLDQLIKEAESYKFYDDLKKVLIAPSWGENGLLERTGGDFIGKLLDNDFDVILRPHPQTRKLRPALLKKIESKYLEYQNFEIDEDMTSNTALLEAFIMISDYSGAALEFAFTFNKPIIFVDVPKKINNKNYEILELAPLEVSIRKEIGTIIKEDNLSDLVKIVIKYQKKQFKKNILHVRKNTVFNLGKSALIGAKNLIEISNET